jgi:hypothetical protein
MSHENAGKRGGVQRTRAFATRTIRAMKLVARDNRIPKPLRWIAGLALLPIPGPVDEVILLLIAPILFVFYREPMHEAWVRGTPVHSVANLDDRAPAR